MIRKPLLIILASVSVFALGNNAAFAQTSNPDTTQTDQSEEDWRKSKKKSSTDDILDIFKNPNSSGVGNTRTYKPVDALPEESRRHLMRERAKRMAEAGIGEPVNTDYKPSEAAKSDPNLKTDEQAAWEDIAKEMNGGAASGAGAGQGGQPSQQPSGQQSGQPSRQSSGQQPGQSGQSQGQPRTPSAMRGGSASSVSDMLNKIKGRSTAPAGVPNMGGGHDAGQTGQSVGQSQGQGQSQAQGQSQSQSQSQGQSQGQSASQGQSDAAGQSQSDAQAQSQAQGQSQSQASAQDSSADAAADASAQSASQAASDATQSPSRTPEAISPLDRLKQNRESGEGSGSRSSASDYLKKKD